MAFSSLLRFANPLANPMDAAPDAATIIGQTPIDPTQTLQILNGTRHSISPLTGGPTQVYDYSTAGGGRAETPQTRALAEASQLMNNFAGPTPQVSRVMTGNSASWEPTPQAMELQRMALTDHAQRMNNAQQSLGQVMQNQLGQARLGLDIEQARGVNGIPGSIFNNAATAHATLLQAQNARLAEDSAADQAAERALNSLMQSRGMSEPDAVAELRRENPNWRAPRRLRGPEEGALSPTPPWMIRPTASAPAYVPAASPVPTAGPLPTPAPPTDAARRQLADAGRLAGAATLGLQTAIDPAAIRRSQQGQIASALTEGSLRIPKAPGIPGPGGVVGPETRVPYSQATQTAYNNAITAAVSQIPDEVWRANEPDIIRRLHSEFGGPNALDEWFNQSNNPFTSDWQQQRQIGRVLALRGRNRTPITMDSDPRYANLFQRFIGNLQNWSNPLIGTPWGR